MNGVQHTIIVRRAGKNSTARSSAIRSTSGATSMQETIDTPANNSRTARTLDEGYAFETGRHATARTGGTFRDRETAGERFFRK